MTTPQPVAMALVEHFKGWGVSLVNCNGTIPVSASDSG